MEPRIKNQKLVENFDSLWPKIEYHFRKEDREEIREKSRKKLIETKKQTRGLKWEGIIGRALFEVLKEMGIDTTYRGIAKIVGISEQIISKRRI